MTREITAMVHVADVERSIAFYENLGFSVRNTFVPEGSTAIAWASLATATNAFVMLVQADEPIDRAKQGVLFYLYCDDVADAHSKLTQSGVAVGAIRTEFYAPRGEFRMEDPDGYVLMMTHTRD